MQGRPAPRTLAHPRAVSCGRACQASASEPTTTSSLPAAVSWTAPVPRGSARMSGLPATGSGASATCRRPARSPDRRHRAGRCAGLHRHARSVRVQRAGRRPGGQQGPAGRHDGSHRRGQFDCANQRPLAEGIEPTAKHFGVTLDFRTLADHFERLDKRSRPALNIASFRRRRRR